MTAVAERDGQEPGRSISRLVSRALAERSMLGLGVVGLAALGLILRLAGIGMSSLGFHPVRQFYGALMARGLWAEMAPGLDATVREAAVAARPGLLEPPVVQGLTAILYGPLGHDALWFAQGVLALIWVLTTAPLWALLVRLLDRTAAAAGCAVWLLLPFAVSASRSLQPDGLMLCLSVACGYMLVRAEDERSVRWWWCALGAGMAAVWVKPTAAFTVLPSWS